MSKVKAKGAKDATKPSTVLNKAKDAGVTKPAQNGKAKAQEMAKKVVKEKGKSRKAKEPTPEADSSEESDASVSDSDTEPEVPAKISKAANTKANGVKAIAKAESSDESDSDSEESDESDSDAGKPVAPVKKAVAEASSDSESDESADEPVVNGVLGKAPAVTEDASSDEDSEEDSEDSDSESDEDTKKPAAKPVKTVKTETKAKAEAEPDSEEDSDGSEDGSDASSESEVEVKAKPTKRKADEEAVPATKKSKTENADTSKGPNLFVGNLSWNVDEDWLRSEFEEFGELAGVRLMVDRQTGRSKGFGYIEYVSAASAAKAHAAKQGTELDNRPLNVDFANAKPANPERNDNRRKSYGDQVGEPSDTLFCGNLSFDVGQEAVTEAFSPHGTILSVRLPTDRETGEPKGFGYVTFTTVEEATGALEAMQGGYINGRPVRLDYSQPRPQNNDSGRGGFGGGRGRGGFGARGGSRGGRGDFNSRGGRGGRGGGRGGARPNTTNRGGFGDYSGKKTTF